MTEPTDLTLHVLREIRDEIRATREDLRHEIRATREELRDEIRGVRDDLGMTNARVDRLAENTVRGFIDVSTQIGGTNHRLERLAYHFAHFREFAGEHWRDHEQRLRALESHVGLPPARS